MGKADVDEIRTLMVRGCIYLHRRKSGPDVLALRPEGNHYMERLQQLRNHASEASACSSAPPLNN